MRPWRGYVSRGWPSAAARPPVPSTALTGCGKTPERLRFAEHSAANAGREKVAKGYCWQISWCVLRILYPQAASRQTPGVLCRRSQQLRQPDPVVGGRRQREHPVHPGRTAEVCLSLPADRFDPAERLFNPLAQDQTEGVARMPRGAPVNGGGAPVSFCATCGVTLRARMSATKPLVSNSLSAPTVMRCWPGMAPTIAVAASASAVPLAWVTLVSTTRQLRFSITAWPMWHSLAAAPAAFL